MKPKQRPQSDGTPPKGETSAPDAVSPQPCRTAPWWVRIFVPFHILAITIYALPLVPSTHLVEGHPRGNWYTNSDWLLFWNENGALIGKQSPPIYGYLMVTGFWQYWDMFAPDPIQNDVYGSAEIIYKDGSKREYQYPRMFLESIPQKYIDERYRKFFERVHDYYNIQNLPNPKPYVAQRFAQRIALLNFDNPANPPVEVKLFIHIWGIPKPGGVLKPAYTSEQFFDYFVEQDQLLKDKEGS